MPRVPTYDNLQTSIRAEAPPSMGPSPGGIVADQIQRTGQALSAAGDAASRIAQDAQQEANDAQFRSIDAGLTERLTALQFDPNEGFASQRGANAMAKFGDYTQRAKKIVDDAAQAAANPRIREMVMRVGGERMNAAVGAMSRHANTEFGNYQIESSDARAHASIQAGAADYTNGPSFAANVGTAMQEAEVQGRLRGWDEAQINQLAQKYTDKAYVLRYDAWRAADPIGALRSFQADAGKVSPATRVTLYHQLFEAAAPSLALQINADGGPGVVAPAAGGAKQPRGVRNNNPGNVMRGADQWQGEVQGNDPRYASFETPEAGIRAMVKTLQTYQDKHQLNTVSDILARWAPATENNTTAYVRTVASALGVKPDKPIDVRDPAIITGLVKSMIKFENGSQPYTDQQIQAGISAANGAPLPATASSPGAAEARTAWRDPSTPTGNAMVDALPSDWKLHVLQLAKAQAAQDMAATREALRSKVQDASTSYMVNGFAPNPPTLGDFVRAYGQAEGQAHFSTFQGVAKLGQQLQQVRMLPTSELEQLAKTSKPVPGPGFAEAEQNHQTLLRAIDSVTQARTKDPIQYAASIGAYGIKAMDDLSNPDKVAAVVAQRASVAGQIARDYATSPTLLTHSESRALGDALKAAPVEVQKRYLGALAGAVPSMDLVKLTMQAIAPDQPVLAMAGVYQARGLRTTENRDVADLLLRGQAILTPNTKTDGTGHEGGRSLVKMPEAGLLLSDFNAATGDAFRGREQAADLFMQASRAIYAAKSAEAGDYSGNLDGKRWRAAISLATGGIQSHNGSSIVMPYGMPYDAFRNGLRDAVDKIAPKVLASTADDMMRLPLENIGDGRYLFRRGAGYLVDKQGQPVVVDLTGRSEPSTAFPAPAQTVPTPRAPVAQVPGMPRFGFQGHR